MSAFEIVIVAIAVLVVLVTAVFFLLLFTGRLTSFFACGEELEPTPRQKKAMAEAEAKAGAAEDAARAEDAPEPKDPQ
jgi:hypothetical protein